MKNSELRFSGLRFEDLITNHYPDICSKLEDFIRRSLDVNNKKGDLYIVIMPGLADWHQMNTRYST
jgi:hypothetical protein